MSNVSSSSASRGDVEANLDSHAFLENQTVRTFSWKNVSVHVKDRETKKRKTILSNASGHVNQGELMVLMGPSGSGKTTLLNLLAHRQQSPGADIEGDVLVNGRKLSSETLRQLSSYVEQEDVLIGSLNVQETLHFAAQLSLPPSISKTARMERISSLIDAFGIRDQAGTLIGTPIYKGISNGQKRRVSVASQLITSPNILFLDEPTSGLDSTASFEVMSFVKNLAVQHKLIVVASIHQPSTTLFQSFDKLLVLSAGKTCYFGSGSEMKTYFDKNGHEMPLQTNPAEFILDLVNTDFASDREGAEAKLIDIQNQWEKSPEASATEAEIEQTISASEKQELEVTSGQRVNFFRIVMALLHRSFIKSYRDIVAYGIRIAMYLGLAILVGTVWLRLDSTQENIQPFINVLFFGSAFMSFMAVAYVPSYLEDRAIFLKERANGLYGSLPFLFSNFIIGLPFLFIIAVIFSVVTYWLVNFRSGAEAFFMFMMWLYLDLLAAESLVVLVSSVFPNFVIALTLTAFANGLWMCVGGFFVSPTILNVFWRYVFHYIDYQAYVFQGMMVNEFSKRPFDCGPDCHCMYQSELASECKIAGTAVLQEYGYATGRTGKWVGILLAIIAVYRLFGWFALVIRKR